MARVAAQSNARPFQVQLLPPIQERHHLRKVATLSRFVVLPSSLTLRVSPFQDEIGEFPPGTVIGAHERLQATSLAEFHVHD